VTFTAGLTGYTSPSYQWYKNGTAISGETSSTLTTATLINNDAIKVAVVEGAANVSTSNLVLNLDAGNSSSYTGSTTSWTDLTGRGNNGTISSGITYNAANGGYFQFPPGGSNGVILPASSTDFNFTTGDFAVDLWANNYNNYGKLISLNTTSNLATTALQIYPVSTTLNAGSLSSTGLTLSTWHNIIYTRISGVVYLYIDGVLKATANDASSLASNGATTSNTLGSIVSASNYTSFSGKMSIARVYKDAGLTSNQVVNNYNAICARYGLAPLGNMSNTITTTITSGPATPTVTTLGDACINKTTLSTPTGLSSYSWSKDNVTISNATSNTYSPTEAGVYKVSVSNGTCTTTSAATTISTCGVTADGRMLAISSPLTLVSNEGGLNFGTGTSEAGSIFNTTGLTTTTGTIGSTTAVLGGVISATNALTSSIGVIYSTDSNFGTYSTTTIQSNVGAGTYTASISGLASSTTYFAKSFIVNKSGTIYGTAVNFTTTTPPIAVGDNYGGGIVIYIAGPTDPGYDANTSHGLIAAKVDLGSMNWNNGSIAGTSNNYFGAGIGNTSIIIAQSGSNGGTNYAAKACDDYTVTETVGGVTTTYSDWYLGSTFEIQKMMFPNPASSYLTGLSNGYYWASNEQTASGPSPGAGAVLGSALYVTKANGGLDQWNKTGGSGIMGVRAIRKF